MLLLATAAAGTAAIPPIICTLLLIATVVAIAVGLFSLIFGGSTFNRGPGGRFGVLGLGLILLVIYIVLC